MNVGEFFVFVVEAGIVSWVAFDTYQRIKEGKRDGLLKYLPAFSNGKKSA